MFKRKFKRTASAATPVAALISLLGCGGDGTEKLNAIQAYFSLAPLVLADVVVDGKDGPVAISLRHDAALPDMASLTPA